MRRFPASASSLARSIASPFATTRPPRDSPTRSTDAPFAVATRDELWLRGRLLEQRLSHGEATRDAHGIIATDSRNDALVAACDAAMEELRRYVLPDLRMRLVAEAHLDGVTSTITVSIGGHSIVTAPDHFAADVELLRQVWSAATPPSDLPDRGADAADPCSLPMLWRNGTAAVLLHESAGHPEEHGQQPLLPEWLHIENPLALRRASFRDVPLLRMTNLVARQHDAPFAVPETRVEVLLVEGGNYDPLTEVVTVGITAADLVEGDRRLRLAPFEYVRPRTAIVYLGASGDPIRYPGVICSREGQELVVGSHAPLLVTR